VSYHKAPETAFESHREPLETTAQTAHLSISIIHFGLDEVRMHKKIAVLHHHQLIISNVSVVSLNLVFPMVQIHYVPSAKGMHCFSGSN
jgi:hypothetical protein